MCAFEWNIVELKINIFLTINYREISISRCVFI